MCGGPGLPRVPRRACARRPQWCCGPPGSACAPRVLICGVAGAAPPRLLASCGAPELSLLSARRPCAHLSSFVRCVVAWLVLQQSGNSTGARLLPAPQNPHPPCAGAAGTTSLMISARRTPGCATTRTQTARWPAGECALAVDARLWRAEAWQSDAPRWPALGWSHGQVRQPSLATLQALATPACPAAPLAGRPPLTPASAAAVAAPPQPQVGLWVPDHSHGQPHRHRGQQHVEQHAHCHGRPRHVQPRGQGAQGGREKRLGWGTPCPGKMRARTACVCGSFEALRVQSDAPDAARSPEAEGGRRALAARAHRKSSGARPGALPASTRAGPPLHTVRRGVAGVAHLPEPGRRVRVCRVWRAHRVPLGRHQQVPVDGEKEGQTERTAFCASAGVRPSDSRCDDHCPASWPGPFAKRHPLHALHPPLPQVRIGGGVYPEIKEPDYLAGAPGALALAALRHAHCYTGPSRRVGTWRAMVGACFGSAACAGGTDYRVDSAASKTMLNTLMYKLSYYE